MTPTKNTEAKSFDLAEVLTIVTGRMLAERKTLGMIADFLGFMTNLELEKHQLIEAADECNAHLLKQHPFLGSAEMQTEIEELKTSLNEEGLSDEEKGRRADAWTARQKAQYGESLMITPIPENELLIKPVTHGIIIVNIG